VSDPSRFEYVYLPKSKNKNEERLCKILDNELSMKGYNVVRKLKDDKKEYAVIVKCDVLNETVLPDNLLTLAFNLPIEIIKSVANYDTLKCIAMRASDSAIIFSDEVSSSDSDSGKVNKLFSRYPPRRGPQIKSINVVGECVDEVNGYRERYSVALADAKFKAAQEAGIDLSVTATVESGVSKQSFYQNFIREIEERSTAFLMPGFVVEDIGECDDGVYRVELRGKIQVE